MSKFIEITETRYGNFNNEPTFQGAIISATKE